MNKISRKKNFKIIVFMVAIVVMLTPVVSFMSFAQDADVKKFIDQVAGSVVSAMKNKTSMKRKRENVKQIIDKNFDVIWMSKFAMGKNYKQLSVDQKKQYLSLYLNYLLNNYFPILAKYDADDGYEILKIQKIDKKEHDVELRLTTRKSESPIVLKYRVRFVGGKYQCLDMVVEGVSTLISQRAEFASIIQRSGVDSFLKQLAAQKDT